MNQQNEPSSPATPAAGPSKGDRKVKLIFLAVAIVAAGIIYWMQKGAPEITGNWPSDLPKVLEQAKKENRKVMALFTESTPGEDEREMAKGTLSKAANRQALEEGKFLCARVNVPSLSSDEARKYAIQKLPTWIVMDSDGHELNRRVGVIGEMEFRNGFLNCKIVQSRPAAP